MKPIQYIRVHSREGRYDICHPCEKSIRTHISICHNEPGCYVTEMQCNITTQEIITSNDPDTLIEEIEKYISRYLYLSNIDELTAIKNYLADNYYRLIYGNAVIEKKACEERLEKLNKTIANCIDRTSEFVQGAWISECE